MLTRMAVFVSGGGTNLQSLIDAQNMGVLKSGRIQLVVSSNPSAFALERAARAGIPTRTVSRKSCSSQEEFEEKISEALDEFDIDMIVLAGFMSILSENFTKKHPKRMINIHPSLIPSFCGKGMYGLHVHKAALDYGVTVTGATVHYVNEIPDGGEIILQRAVNVRRGDTPETLQKRVMEQAEWRILPRAAEIVSKRIAKEKKA